jgi:phosphomethylpyrimidine synthase
MNAEEVYSRNLTGDMVKNNDRVQDLEMGRARRDMLWERQFQLAIDPETAKRVRSERAPSDSMVCTMCGDYCALKIVKRRRRTP